MTARSYSATTAAAAPAMLGKAASLDLVVAQAAGGKAMEPLDNVVEQNLSSTVGRNAKTGGNWGRGQLNQMRSKLKRCLRGHGKKPRWTSTGRCWTGCGRRPAPAAPAGRTRPRCAACCAGAPPRDEGALVILTVPRAD